jgi:hypothetical protein
VTLVGRTAASGQPVVGAPIKLDGIVQRDGSILARSARIGVAPSDSLLAETKVRGELQKIVYGDDGRITAVVIQNRQIIVSALTRIHVALRQGMYVEVSIVLTPRFNLASQIAPAERQEASSDTGSDESSSTDAESLEDAVSSFEIEGRIEEFVNAGGVVQTIAVQGQEMQIIAGRTRIRDGRLGMNVPVHVTGTVSDGQYSAGEIVVLSESQFEASNVVSEVVDRLTEGLRQ